MIHLIIIIAYLLGVTSSFCGPYAGPLMFLSGAIILGVVAAAFEELSNS